jgi:hypothetical protein
MPHLRPWRDRSTPFVADAACKLKMGIRVVLSCGGGPHWWQCPVRRPCWRSTWARFPVGSLSTHRSACCELLDDCLMAHMLQKIAGVSSWHVTQIHDDVTVATEPSITVAQPEHCWPCRTDSQPASQFWKLAAPRGHLCFDARMAVGDVFGAK